MKNIQFCMQLVHSVFYVARSPVRLLMCPSIFLLFAVRFHFSLTDVPCTKRS